MTWANIGRGLSSCVLLVSLPGLGLAQDQDASGVDQLQKKIEDLELKISALQEQAEQGQSELDETLDEMDEQMLEFSKRLSEAKPGKRNFLITGYAFGGYENAEGEDSTFSAGFVPIFLWKPTERIFLEAEVEFELEDDETEVELEYVQMSYVLHDYVTLGLGKFLNPANPFASRLHPAWINKLPDAPLALGPMAIMPFTQLGVQMSGGVPLGSQKINYALYASNGSNLEAEETNYGTLNGDNYTDLNNNKAVGGRVGYFPLPELEFGYSLELSQVTASGSDVDDADATIQSLDLNYVTSVAKGTLDLRAQWVTSDVDNVVFDPTGVDGFGPISLNNERSGGYVQAAFRPSDFKDSILSDFEGVLRYDEVDLPTGAPEGVDQSRVTFGVNYWASSSSVFKLAFQFDDKDGAGEDSDALLFQWAIGF